MKEQIKVMISETEVDNRISEMAAAIDKAYAGKAVHLIGILKGSVFFMCELAKKITVPVTILCRSAVMEMIRNHQEL